MNGNSLPHVRNEILLGVKTVCIDSRDDHQRTTRQIEIDEEKRKEQERAEVDRKNHGFAQVYDPGWERLKGYLKGAGLLYAFLSQHIDPSCGAVVASQQFLASELGVSTRTIREWSKQLEIENALVRIPIAGKVYAYAIAPEEVWKGYDNGKKYAAFYAKTLANKDGDITRRLMSMFECKQKPKSGQQQSREQTSPA